MGSFHLFVHPKQPSYHFGKTGFRPIFVLILVPKKPIFKTFSEFRRVKTGHHGLKMGQKHLFEYPKWSRNKFGKSDFGAFLDPQMIARALHALNTTLSCQNGALKGADNVEKAQKWFHSSFLITTRVPNASHANKTCHGKLQLEKVCKKGAFQGRFCGILGRKRGH